MLKAGYRYTLPVVSSDQREHTLQCDSEQIKIARRLCPPQLAVGQELDVFIYLDRNNELQATTQMPLAAVDEFAYLTVKSVASHGAFLDWGVEKDLLCPHPQQHKSMQEGRSYIVYITLDQNDRPIASSRLERFIEQENSDLQEGDEVEILTWSFTDLGLKVIVNNRYEALLYKDDIPADLRRGQSRRAWVRKIREDRRIDIALNRPGMAGISDARSAILALLEEEDPLELNDQSSPELIQNRLGISKKMFKKALGGLYKDKQVSLDGDVIRKL